MADAKPRNTYFITDERMLKHKSEFDEHHIEIPERLQCILDILRRENVLEECEVLKAKSANIADLRLVHSQEIIDEIQRTQFIQTTDELEEYSSMKEDIYVNQNTYECALLAAGSSVHLLETVLQNPGSNGFAAVRPPGHHASENDPCGFCIFNNVAICAKKARQLGVERVLIVDWDVHAGQGTQYCIEGETGIKLISIHRFEEGTFWPELAESGVLHPYKNTINVPLNELGYGDAEYAAILNFLVLPIIAEWKPQLILVSCGYDAAIGDPQGDMNVSPGGYAYMTGALAALDIPLVLLLEGGYFIHSVAQGALYTMNALVQKNQLGLNMNLRNPSKKFMLFLEFIISNYTSEFEIFRTWSDFMKNYRKQKNLPEEVEVLQEFKGKKMLTFPHPTRGLYSSRNEAETRKFDEIIAKHLAHYKTPFEQNESIRVKYDHGKAQFEIDSTIIKIANETQFYIVFIYILIPLSFVRKINFVHSKGDEQQMINGLFRLARNAGDFKTTIQDASEHEFFEKITKLIDSYEFIKNYFDF